MLQIEVNGVKGVGESERDFIAGDDVDLRSLKESPKQDNVWYEVDQSYGIYTHACTMMSAYTALCGLRNIPCREDVKEAIVRLGEEKGYVIGEGWWTKKGVSTAIDYWNERYPDKKTIYIRTTYGSEQYKIALEKNLPVVMSYKTSYGYTKDRFDDGVVDGKSFDNFYGGHAIVGKKSEKYPLEHINTYPKGKYNFYGVKHPDDLFGNRVYYPSVYIVVPEFIDKEKLLKKKAIEAYMRMGEYIKGLSDYGKTVDVIDGVNDYFRSVGF